MKQRSSAPSAPEASSREARDTGEYWSQKLQGADFTPERFWCRVPGVEQRFLERVSADGLSAHWAEACVRELLAGRTPVERMLSVGCGTGELERVLAHMNAFRECDAWDIAAGGIETARRLAAEEGIRNIRYEVRDATVAELPPDHYDAVWFESSLHHIEPLERVCEQVARGLKPDGFLFLYEYVGPSAFAFSPRQRELIRAAFALIPRRFRRSFEPGMPEHLTSAPIPMPAEVTADDPTEAVRSADILPVVADYFDVVSLRETGGTLLQFLLHGIAGNFRPDDPEAMRVLRMLMEVEDALMEVGEVKSDFIVLAARPRKPVVARPPRPRASPPQDEALSATVEDELAEKRMYLAQAERYARNLEAEAVRKQAQVEELEGYIRSLEETLASRQAQIDELEAHVRSVEPTLASRQAQIDELEAHVRSVEPTLARRKAQVEELETQVRSRERTLARRQAQVEELEAYARSLESTLARKQTQVEELEAYIRSLELTLERKGENETQVERYVRTLEAEVHSLAQRRPKVHAVTVHHRGKELLECCLRSLLASQGVTIEIVVVSNACEEPLPDSAGSESRVHVVRSETSLGFSAANNLGVAWAREHLGEPAHWFFINNDALVEPDTLIRLAAALDATPHGGVAGPRLQIWGAEDHLNSLGLNVTAVGEAWDEGIGLRLEDYGPLPGRREVLAVTGSALLIRAAALSEIGGWSELYGYYMEDIDLCLQAWSCGWRVIHDPDAVASHAISATADQITDFKRFHSWRNQLLLVLVHWPAGTLLRSGPRLVGSQLRVFVQRLRLRCHADARLQARIWASALKLLPTALKLRRRHGGDRSWVRFLRKPGTVPAIRLPAIPPGRRPWERSSS